MKIVEVSCGDCDAKFEILENFPKDLLACPGCGSKNLALNETEREFTGCGGGCGSCDSCH